MPPNQNEKAERFRALHALPGTFVIPNPWDAGTARILSALGFPALATTSAGFAFSIGRRDGDGAVRGCRDSPDGGRCGPRRRVSGGRDDGCFHDLHFPTGRFSFFSIAA